MSAQNIPSLADLVGFNLPLTKVVGVTEKGLQHSIACNETELDGLRTASMNAEAMLHTGIPAIMALLITIDLHCPEDADRWSRINALALVHELSLVLRALSDVNWVLDSATPDGVRGDS